jgi:antitoxin component YwqK of YwqJK toxin-antitoxin module
MDGKIRWTGKLFSDGANESFDSICTWYSNREFVSRRAFFIKGKEEGTDTIFYYKDEIHELRYYHNGKREGEWKTFYREGFLLSKSYFKNDKQEGNDSLFYQGGKPQSVRAYIDGHKQGKVISWFEDGKIQGTGYFRNDTAEGEWIDYFKNGCKANLIYYLKGQPTGKSFEFNSVTCDTSVVRIYSPKGELMESYNYDEHHHVIEHFTADTVKNISETTRFNSDGRISNYTITWNKTHESYLKDFYENGNRERSIFIKGSYEIWDTTWYHNGTIEYLTMNDPNNGNTIKNLKFDSLGKLIEEVIPDSLELHIAKDNYACLYGLKDVNDKWIVKATYQMINDPINGFFEIDLNEKWGILDMSGKEIIAPQYDNIDILGGTSGERYIDFDGYYGKFVVEENGMYGMINFKNEIILPFEFNSIMIYNNEILSLQKDGKYGFSDESGFVSEIKFNRPLYFQNNNLCIYSADEANVEEYELGHYGVIDLKGKTIIPPLYDRIIFCSSQDGLIEVTKGEKNGLYDSTGKILLDTLYTLNLKEDVDGFHFFENNIALISKNKKFGIIGTKGNFLVPLKYDSLEILSSTCVIYEKNNKYGLLGKNLQPISDANYSSIKFLGQVYDEENFLGFKGFFLAKRNGKYGIVNEKDSVILPFSYNDAWITDQREQLFLEKGNHLDLFYNGSLLNAENFKNQFEFHNGRAPFSKTSLDDNEYIYYRSGIVKEDGTILLQPQFEIISNTEDDLIFQDSTGRSGGLDKSGKIKMFPKNFSELYDDGNFLCFMVPSGKVGLMSRSGKIIIDTLYYALYPDRDNKNLYWVKSTPIQKDAFGRTSLLDNWGIIDTTGKIIAKTEWEFPANFVDSIMINRMHNKCGLVGQNGKVLLEANYDVVTRDVNGYFILKKNELYGFASPSGKIIAEPHWSNVTGFLGDYMLVYDSSGVALIDTSGKIIEKEDSCSKFKTNLSEKIDFYKGDFQEGFDHDYSQTQTERLSEAIYRFDSLEEISNSGGRIAAENYVCGLEAMNYWYTWNPDVWDFGVTTSYLYWKGMRDYEEDPNNSRKESHQFDCYVDSVTSVTFSMTLETTICEPDNYSYDPCGRETNFLNYDTRGGALVKLQLKDLFDPTKNYRVTLNSLIGSAVHAMDNVEIDCSNPDTYMDQVGENFSIGENGITFYLPNSNSSYSHEFGENNHLAVFIPYSKMKNIIGKKSVLQEVMKKK